MFELWGATHVADSYADLGFRSTAGWLQLEGRRGPEMTFVLLGDEQRGPAIGLFASPPGSDATSSAHASASDNLRAPLLGEITIDHVRYQPGDFRFQRAWSTYPGDNRSSGPHGGWELMLLGDRRGARVHLTGGAPNAEVECATRVQGEIADFFGLARDLFSDDPDDAPETPSLVTTLGEVTPTGELNGSFADQECYLPVSDNARAAFALLGERDVGPLVVLASTEPLHLAAPAARFDTEVFRIVLSGSYEIAGKIYEAGDARVQRAGTWCAPVEAGPDGLEEVVVLGDRRRAAPEVKRPQGWTAHIADALELLTRQLEPVPLSQP